jgi:predicted PurR-regulated permease PerM
MAHNNYEISLRTIISAFILLFVAWILFLIRDVLVTIFVALILALALEPFVKWFVSKKVPHGLSVLLVSILFILLLVGIGSVAIAPLISEFQKLLINLPGYISAVDGIALPGYDIDINAAVFSRVSDAAGNVLNATLGAFSGVLTFLLVLVFTIYILLDFANIRQMFVNLFPDAKRNEVTNILMKVETKLGGWLRGQLVLMFLVGLTTYFGLVLLGVDYALALAVIAGLLEIVPVIGPIISVIPAAIVAFVMSPLTGLGVLGLYTLIQQLENHLLVPKVMQKAVGFNPLVTIVALMVGAKLLGVIGAILAIPFAILFTEIAKYFLHPKDK